MYTVTGRPLGATQDPKAGLDRAMLLEATGEALAYLREVVAQTSPTSRGAGVAVSAAARLCEMHKWLEDREDLDKSFVTSCGGPEKAAEWLLQNAERLSRRLGVALPAQIEAQEGVSEDGDSGDADTGAVARLENGR